MSFHRLLCLIQIFLLLPFSEFESNLSHFHELPLNLYKVIATLQFILKSPIASRILDLSYYTMAETEIINKAITITLPDFVEKAAKTKYKYLQNHIVNVMNELELL